VDLDPQACLTYSLGLRPDDLAGSLHGVLVNRQPIEDIVAKVVLDAAPPAGHRHR
jgi:cellulose biosynthesis protein BcsQ